MATSSELWSLRRALEKDVDALHAILCIPEVYRYLMDGVAPSHERAEEWIKLNPPCSVPPGLGLWLLEESGRRLAGCVCLAKDSRPRTAELTYFLHPAYWGKGLATRMGWTVIEHAFQEQSLDQVIAGADEPNQASISVMKRLGMGYLRRVRYPLGPGLEYALQRDGPKPTPRPNSIPRLE